jgi:general secretion pathway protein G
MKLRHLPRRRFSNAFTLMEMMLVLGIIALLIAVVAALSPKFMVSAEITAAQAKITTINTAVMGYKNNNRKYPAKLEHLVTPPPDARVRKGSLNEDGITDPWGEKFQLRSPGKDGAPYEIYSMGPDKKDGTDDDVYQ